MPHSDLYMLLKALERDVEAVCLEYEENEVCKRIASLVRAYMRRVEDKTISEFLKSYFY
ncbi:MAG: hypothetical protein QN229_05935 [Desulfurococcaceae archaeon TW002]